MKTMTSERSRWARSCPRILLVLLLIGVVTACAAGDEEARQTPQEATAPLTRQEAIALKGRLTDRIVRLGEQEEKTDEQARLVEGVVGVGLGQDNRVEVHMLSMDEQTIVLFRSVLLADLDGAEYVRLVQGVPEEPAAEEGVLRDAARSLAGVVRARTDGATETAIDGALRAGFDRFCQDVCMWYMPTVGADGLDDPGAGVFYLFAIRAKDGTFPETLPGKTVERELRELFGVQDWEHGDYGKLARYEDGNYRVPPMGLTDATAAYLLQTLEAHEENGTLRMRANALEYVFSLSPGYEPDANAEKLMALAEGEGVAPEQVLRRCVQAGDMQAFEWRRKRLLAFAIDEDGDLKILQSSERFQ